MKFLLLLLLLLVNGAYAEEELQKLTVVSIKGEKSIALFKDHSKMLRSLRRTLLEHHEALSKVEGKEKALLQKNILNLKKNLIEVERQMYKLYGMIPGLVYGSELKEAHVYLLYSNPRLKKALMDNSLKMEDIHGYVEQSSSNGISERLNKVRVMEMTQKKNLELFKALISYEKDLKSSLALCRKELKKKLTKTKKAELLSLIKDLRKKKFSCEKNMLEVYGLTNEDKYLFEEVRLDVHLYLSVSELKSISVLPSSKTRLLKSLK